MPKLTARQIPKLATGRHSDGGTLTLLVTATGGRSWVQRLTIDGRRVDLGLGGWPVVTLAAARDAALANRRKVHAGEDPRGERRKASVPTFEVAAERTIAANRPAWKHADRMAEVWRRALAAHAFPVFGSRRLDQIERADVIGILDPIWGSKPQAARSLRRYVSAVFAWGVAHDLIARNPADGLDAALPAQRTVTRHFPAMDHGNVAAALVVIDASRASDSVKACLRFVALTACRSAEARGMTWAEVDRDAATWTIPAEKMKGQKAHTVPLSPAAIAVLDAMRPAQVDPSAYVFRGRTPGGPLSQSTLLAAAKTNGLGGSIHGFRTSFRTWAAETGAPFEVAELCLAHNVGSNVERAYSRSNLLDRRRELMDRWADYIT